MTSDTTATTASPRPLILVVDDDPDIAQLLARYFTANGYAVAVAPDGATMHATLATREVGLVLLDLGLPDTDGLELTREVRRHWQGPIIIVTGRGDAVDRVVGLELGADDYVTKPFDLRELLARVRSVMRRARAVAAAPAYAAATAASRSYAFAGFTLDPASRTLRAADGGEIPLTSGEFDLLHVLVEQPNRVLSRDQLMSRMHGRDAGPFDRAIDVQIGRLRRKIEGDPQKPGLIKSVRGAGYLFAARVERS